MTRLVAVAGVTGLALAMIGPASADETVIRSDDGAYDNPQSTHDHHQHGGEGGHLPATSENVELVSKAAINQDVEGRVADVGFFGNYAYLGAFNERDCQKGGVYVFDVHDITKPEQINFIRTGTNSFVGEGVQTIHIDTPKYTGDVLALNNEICDKEKKSTTGGMTLVDVTNPKSHKYLVEGFGDFDLHGTRANQIHSVFMWDAGDKAYAVLVDDEESTDVDIVDITDPRNPVLIAEHDLAAQFPQILQAGLDEVFHHDMIVKEINGRQMMLISYWDAGYVQLDVTDPVHPTYVADSDFTDPDPELKESTGDERAPEGNGHQSEYTLDNEYVIAADEDFSPFALTGTNNTDSTAINAGQGSNTKPLEPGQTISGQSKFVGRACNGDPAPPAGDGTQIAVVERGVCTFTEKVANVEAAGGYAAILIFNRTGSDACNGSLGMSVEGGIPTFGVAPREQGYNIFDTPYDDAECEAGDGSQQAPITLGATGDSLTFTSYFDGWGYVHLYRNNAGKMEELDTYALPEAHDVDFATGFGDLSVHEVATSHQQADLAYFAYYSGGLRVTRIQDGKLVEVGRYIDQGGNNFWGVQVFERDGVEYVAASDRDHGIYIFRYTGP
ncbi:MAG: PA domain-containing protein [Micromonosporaceae bacterium]